MPKKITLVISFSIDQESDRPDWVFEDAEGNKLPIGKDKDTGMFCLERDWVVGLRVEGAGHEMMPSPFSFEVLNCHLITKPKLFSWRANPEHAGRYPYPSPFFDPQSIPVGQGAVVDFGYGQSQAGADGTQQWTSLFTYHCRNEGSWDVRFVMTVAIDMPGTPAPQYRVFTFDPETQVGAGTLPPH
jgi:hypothetical protein